MWPWSTIKALRREVSSLLDVNERVGASAKRSQEGWEHAIERNRAFISENRVLTDARDVLSMKLTLADAKVETQQTHIDAQTQALRAVETERDVLRISLNQCSKNNTKDPKTGRFVKAVGWGVGPAQ